MIAVVKVSSGYPAESVDVIFAKPPVVLDLIGLWIGVRVAMMSFVVIGKSRIRAMVVIGVEWFEVDVLRWRSVA